MKKSFLLLGLFSLVLSSLLFVSCDNDDDDNGSNVDPNIVEFASADANFSILAQAVVQAGLDDDLSGDGPFTVFAPTNDAFEAFLAQKGFASLEDVPNDVLVSILTNHVLASEVRSTDLSNGYVSTISSTKFGSNVSTSLYVNVDNGVTINGVADVTTADVDVSNGVIHAIDAVIDLPTVVTFATADPNFSTLTAALTLPGLSVDFVSVLSGDGPFTVFAPTNAAFEALLNSNPDWNQLSDIPTGVLEEVLLYHVTDAGNVRSTDLVDGIEVSTLAMESFTIDLSSTPPTINAFQNTAGIIATDVQATNGVIHAIDAVILPDLN
ncbi:MAG: fasciclin domain-containing protein [Saprospiraceae bacterium]|nr:fasciclin domain-containing protein [Saprospiraceae bacterium]